MIRSVKYRCTFVKRGGKFQTKVGAMKRRTPRPNRLQIVHSRIGESRHTPVSNDRLLWQVLRKFCFCEVDISELQKFSLRYTRRWVITRYRNTGIACCYIDRCCLLEHNRLLWLRRQTEKLCLSKWNGCLRSPPKFSVNLSASSSGEIWALLDLLFRAKDQHH